MPSLSLSMYNTYHLLFVEWWNFRCKFLFYLPPICCPRTRVKMSCIVSCRPVKIVSCIALLLFVFATWDLWPLEGELFFVAEWSKIGKGIGEKALTFSRPHQLVWLVCGSRLWWIWRHQLWRIWPTYELMAILSSLWNKGLLPLLPPPKKRDTAKQGFEFYCMFTEIEHEYFRREKNIINCENLQQNWFKLPRYISTWKFWSRQFFVFVVEKIAQNSWIKRLQIRQRKFRLTLIHRSVAIA